MLLEVFTNPKSIDNIDYDPTKPVGTDNPKEVSISYKDVPKEISGDINKVIEWFQHRLQCKNEIGKLNNFLVKHNVKPVEGCSVEEQAQRKKIHDTLIENYVKYTYDKLLYEDHVLPDFGQRYYSDGIMHATADKEADLKFNQRVRDLIQMAEEGQFADGSESLKNPEIAKAKQEFIQLHRDYLSKVKVFDLKKMAANDFTDEELAKYPGQFHEAALLGGQFDNIKDNFKAWGIHDDECSKIMKDYHAFGGYASMISQRLGQILSPSYQYYKAGPVVDVYMMLDEAGADGDIGPTFWEMAQSVKNTEDFAVNAEIDLVIQEFKARGVKYDDVYVIDNETGEVVNAGNAVTMWKKNPNITFVDKNNLEDKVTARIDDSMFNTRTTMNSEDVQKWWNQLQKTLDEAGCELDLNVPEDTARLNIFEIDKKGPEEYEFNVTFAMDPAQKSIDVTNITKEEVLARQTCNKPRDVIAMRARLYEAAQKGLLVVTGHNHAKEKFKRRQILVGSDGLPVVGNDIDHPTKEEADMTRVMDKPDPEDIEGMDLWNRAMELKAQNPNTYRAAYNLAVIDQQYYGNVMEYGEELVAFGEMVGEMHKEYVYRNMTENQRNVHIHADNISDSIKRSQGQLMVATRDGGRLNAKAMDLLAKVFVDRAEMLRVNQAIESKTYDTFKPLTEEEYNNEIAKIRNSKEFIDGAYMLSNDDIELFVSKDSEKFGAAIDKMQDKIKDLAQRKHDILKGMFLENIKIIKETIPNFEMSDEAIESYLTNERMSMHEKMIDYDQKSKEIKDSAQTLPVTFRRIYFAMADRSGTVEAKEYNEKLHNMINLPTKEGEAYRAQLLAKWANKVKDLDANQISFEKSFGEMANYTLDNIDALEIGMDFEEVNRERVNELGLVSSEETNANLKNIQNKGVVLGGLGRSIHSMMNSDFFLTLPFNDLSIDQVMMLIKDADKFKTLGQSQTTPHDQLLQFANYAGSKVAMDTFTEPSKLEIKANDFESKTPNFADLKEQIVNLAKDFKNADNWYNAKNSDEYKKLRTALNKAADDLSKVDGQIDPAHAQGLYEKICDINKLVVKYIDHVGAKPKNDIQSTRLDLAKRIKEISANAVRGKLVFDVVVTEYNDGLAKEYYNEVKNTQPSEEERIFNEGITKTETLRNDVQTLEQKPDRSKEENIILGINQRVLDARDQLTNLVGREELDLNEIRPLLTTVMMGNSFKNKPEQLPKGLETFDALVEGVSKSKSFEVVTEKLNSHEVNVFLQGPGENSLFGKYNTVHNAMMKKAEELRVKQKESFKNVKDAIDDKPEIKQTSKDDDAVKSVFKL